MHAVILAGGKGTRLKPFTNAIPKPLVPIGDMPILEIVLRQLRYYGVTSVTLAVNHLARLIQAFFSDGSELGLDIAYSLEDQPLGTAAPLREIDKLPESFLIMNGDVLTTLDFADLMAFHKEHGNAITIATFERKVKIDLGVLKVESGTLADYIEKPEYSFTVSTGIYACKRDALSAIPETGRFDMPQLVLALKESGRRVGVYSGDFEWLDIGRLDDYETAVALFEEKRDEYLPG